MSYRIYTYHRTTARILAISGRTTLANARRLADQSAAWHGPTVDVVQPA